MVGKLLPGTYQLLQEYICLTLAVCDSNLWRERRVEKIRAIDNYAYLQSTSYQFTVPHALIAASIRSLVRDARSAEGLGLPPSEIAALNRLAKSGVDDNEIDLVIPLDRFGKRVLSGFSIKDGANHVVPFLSRTDSSRVGTHVLQIDLEREGGSDNSLREAIGRLSQGCESLLESLIYCSPQELELEFGRDKLQRDSGLEPQLATKTSAPSDVVDSYTSYVSRTCNSLSADSFEVGFRQRKKIRKILANVCNLDRIIEGECVESVQNHQGLRNIALNPLLLIGDYLSGQIITNNRDTRKCLDAFLDLALRYVSALQTIAVRDKDCFLRTFGTLSYAAYNYIGFFKLSVKVGVPFIIKSEQVLPAVATKWPFYVGYGLNLGFEKSWHLEISCPSPTEIFLDAPKNYVEVEGLREYFVPSEFFGAEVASSRERVHYYKSLTWEEIVRKSPSLIGKSDIGIRPKVYLWVRYRIAWPVKMSYWFSFGVVLLSLLYLVILKENLGIPRWIPMATPLIVFLLAIREKETMTAQKLSKWKVATLVVAGGLYFYLLGLPVVVRLKEMLLALASFLKADLFK